MPDFKGVVEIQDSSGDPTLVLDGVQGDLAVGGNGQDGRLIVTTGSGTTKVDIDAGTGAITISGPDGEPVVTIDGHEGDIRVYRKVAQTRREILRFDASTAALYVGGEGNEGDVIIRDEANRQRIKLDGGAGDIWVKDASGNLLFHFDSTHAALWLGGGGITGRTPSGNEGDLVVRDGFGNERVKLDGGAGDIWVKDASGNLLFHFDSTHAALWLGGKGNEGDLVVRDAANTERIKLDSGRGDIVIRDAAAKARITLDGDEGDIKVTDPNGYYLLHFDSQAAALYLGGLGNEGDLIVRNEKGAQTIKLDGSAGDIILSNADAAEDFAVASGRETTPGTVMVLSEDGTLEPCTGPYDRKVVGVVSGAGPYRPGIVLDRKEASSQHRVPISVMGKVACRADAGYGRIRAGDLLTTSPSPGCAMKAADSDRGSGAILGKALGCLDAGRGLVPILVTLQ
jgi:DNA-binding beta-propeller fold protein YncE